MPPNQQYQANIRRLPLNLWARLIDISTDIDTLLRIEESCFDEAMRDNREFFYAYANDPNAVGLLIMDDAEPIGYLIGTKINEENSPGIFERYPDIEQKKDKTFYLESISILPEHRSPIAFDFALHEVAVLAKRLGYSQVTGHAIRRRGYSRLLQRRYGAKRIHTYEDWQGWKEPFDYVFFERADLVSLSRIEYALFNVLRRLRWWFQSLRNKFRGHG